jgi:CheY-like chemotaxis protein
MPDGGTMTVATSNIHVDTTRDDQALPGPYVCISVTDTGVGMDAVTMERAFDPFFTTKPLGQGTGLGLSMIYGFARQSEGFTRISSDVGKGTTVQLYLPRFDGEVRREPAPTPVLAEAEHGDTVLVVEDDPIVRGLIVNVLNELSYRALEASDGPSGLRILQSDEAINLLVTDIGLPGLNGRQVADAGRQRNPDLKVLFITGYAENAAAAEGFLEPGMAMLTKPFPIETLATKIKDMIGT